MYILKRKTIEICFISFALINFQPFRSTVYLKTKKKASSPNHKRDKYVNFLNNTQSTVLQSDSRN